MLLRTTWLEVYFYLCATCVVHAMYITAQFNYNLVLGLRRPPDAPVGGNPPKVPPFIHIALVNIVCIRPLHFQ